MLPKLDVKNAKDLTTPKIVLKRMKVRPLKKHTTHNLYNHSNLQGGFREAAPGYYQRNNFNQNYQERRQTLDDTLKQIMADAAKRHEENSTMIKEIRASTDTITRNQGASIKALE